MLNTVYGKILVGLVILALGSGVGYLAMPDKIETVIETVTETKYVSVVDKTQVNALNVKLSDIAIEKQILELEIKALVAGSTIEVIKLQELRADKVDGWVVKLEKKIEKSENQIEPIDDEIEVLEDEIVLQEKAINLLQAQIDSKQYLIEALIEDEPVANLTQIRLLEDEIIVLRDDIKVVEEVIEGLEDEIELKEEDKKVLSDKIILDIECILEIERYVEEGTGYSEEVSERLENLGLI